MERVEGEEEVLELESSRSLAMGFWSVNGAVYIGDSVRNLRRLDS